MKRWKMENMQYALHRTMQLEFLFYLCSGNVESRERHCDTRTVWVTGVIVGGDVIPRDLSFFL